MDTIAGLAVGKNENQIVKIDDENKHVSVLTIKGRYFYVKKCVRDEMLGDIVIPEKTQKDTTFCLVLAIGTGVGKYHRLTNDDERLNDVLFEKRHDHMFDIVPLVPRNVDVYDKIFAPDLDLYGNQRGISRVTGTNDEYLIHECLVIGKYEDKDDE